MDSRLQFISVSDIFDIFEALVSIRKDISKSCYIFPTKPTKTSRSQKKKKFLLTLQLPQTECLWYKRRFHIFPKKRGIVFALFCFNVKLVRHIEVWKVWLEFSVRYVVTFTRSLSLFTIHSPYSLSHPPIFTPSSPKRNNSTFPNHNPPQLRKKDQEPWVQPNITLHPPMAVSWFQGPLVNHYWG
jgi:hypothetical protein